MSSTKRRRGSREFVLLAIAVSLSLFLIIFLIEFSAKLVLGYLGQDSGVLARDFITRNSKAFTGSDDFDEVKELWVSDGGCRRPRIVFNQVIQFPEYEKKEYSCKGETLVAGRRLTVGQPTDWNKSVYVFGGSTVWGSGASDQNTIASYLQHYLGAEGYKVENLGFSTVTISQQLSLLKSIDLKDGDVVVFYDGANDIWQGVIYGKPEGTIIGYNESHKIEVILNRLKYTLANYSNFYRLLARLRKNNQGHACRNLEKHELSNRISSAVAHYKKKIIDAKNYTQGNGARFYHFFQPNLVSSNGQSDYILELKASMSPEMLCGVGIVKQATQAFITALYQPGVFFNETLRSENLSGILDPEVNQRDFFIDWVHVTGPANNLIANHLASVIDESTRGK